MSLHRARLLFWQFTDPAASGAGTTWPFEGLQNVGKWPTRVKKWRVTGIHVEDTVNTQNFDLNLVLTSPLGFERQTMLNNQTFSDSQAAGSPEVTFVVQLFLKPVPMKETISDTDYYYAYVKAVLSISADDGGTPQPFFSGDSVDPGGAEYTDGFTFDGNFGTGYYSNGGPFPSDQFEVSGSLVFTPEEYWPWESRDGNPIYDTADGSVLPGESPKA